MENSFPGSWVTQATCEYLARDFTGAGAAQGKNPAAEASSGPGVWHRGWCDRSDDVGRGGPSYHAVVTFHRRLWSRECVRYCFNVLPLAVLGRPETGHETASEGVSGRP